MMLASPLLSAIPGLRHAFFTREGGVSSGIYRSLNAGIGSQDDPASVTENRRRMAEQIGVLPAAFPHRAPDPFARCHCRHRAMAGWIAAPRRRHRHPHRGPCDRRHRGRLRPDPAGRRGRAGDWCCACGLEGRADRHPGIRHRGDGKARRRARPHHRRDRSPDPPAELRGRRRIRRALHRGGRRERAVVPAIDARRPFHVRPRRLHQAAGSKPRACLSSTTSASTPMPTKISSAIAARCTARSRTTAATFTPSCLSASRSAKTPHLFSCPRP